MPRLGTVTMQQRQQFIADYRRRIYTMSELCARFNISRKTTAFRG